MTPSLCGLLRPFSLLFPGNHIFVLHDLWSFTLDVHRWVLRQRLKELSMQISAALSLHGSPLYDTITWKSLSQLSRCAEYHLGSLPFDQFRNCHQTHSCRHIVQGSLPWFPSSQNTESELLFNVWKEWFDTFFLIVYNDEVSLVEVIKNRSLFIIFF